MVKRSLHIESVENSLCYVLIVTRNAYIAAGQCVACFIFHSFHQ